MRAQFPTTVTVARPVTVAAGVFAPGHLGELTRYLPFELVDDVLAVTGTVQRRLRSLPSRAGVYFVLALALFPGLGYARVWAKLCAGPVAAGAAAPAVSEKALRVLRRRLGPAPMKALFEVVAGPLAQPRTPGVCFAGLRTVAFDGISSLRVPDTERNRCWLGRVRGRLGWAGYPTVRLLTLVETGTRGLLGATLAGPACGELTLARRLLGLLGPGMLLLADRVYDANDFLAAVARTGAQLLVRAKSSRNPRVELRLPDGSYRSRLDGLPVRVIDADLDVHGGDGTRTGDRYRLITTLLDHTRYPAVDLVRLYHERWEIESAYLALRHTLLRGHVLRSGDRPGIEQEIWALLTVYQLLRRAMVDAVETHPGTDPDRASFTTALQTARDQLTAAHNIDDPDPTNPDNYLGAIGTAVLATPLPPRRPRYSARTVKSGTSRYAWRATPDTSRPTTSTPITAITITITAPPLPERTPQPTPTRAPTRRDRITAIMTAHPHRAWTGQELAEHLQVATRNLLTQLAEWTRLGFLTRTSPGSYTLNTS